jgi:murein DD-endopeptidase MepM/ murein hydrolase activator NlpD
LFIKKYKYNKETLNYERIKFSFKKLLIYILFFIIFGFTSILTISYFYNTPKEKKLIEKIDNLYLDYQIMNIRLRSLNFLLDEVLIRDTSIYRELFASNPNLYDDIKDFDINKIEKVNNSNYLEIVNKTYKRISQLEYKISVSYYEMDTLQMQVQKNKKFFEHVPAIQPISNRTLKRTASGWGYRIDPIYRTKKFHYGIDFSAKNGTPIYATGNGVIIHIDDKVKSYTGGRGYGNHVIIDHGYGYKTLYAHMSKINVKKGQVVKRNHVIGEVGNTGKSTGPHLHYEVMKDNKKINPIGFFFNDLTADEYDEMVRISSQMNQTFD